MIGYIKLHRQIMENELYLSEPFTKSAAWIDLLLLASYKDSIKVVRGIEIHLKPGDLFWSQESLAQRWKWSRKKVGWFQRSLRKKSQISINVYNKIGIISITNWSVFQEKDTTEDTTEDPGKIQKRSTEDTLTNKYNKYKKYKNKGEDIFFKKSKEYVLSDEFLKSLNEHKVYGKYKIKKEDIEMKVEEMLNWNKSDTIKDWTRTCRNWLLTDIKAGKFQTRISKSALSELPLIYKDPRLDEPG